MVLSIRYLTAISLFLLAAEVAAASVAEANSHDWRQNFARGDPDDRPSENSALGAPGWRRSEVGACGMPELRRSEKGGRGPPGWRRLENDALGQPAETRGDEAMHWWDSSQ